MLEAMNGERTTLLQVFVEPTCETCRRAIQLAEGVDAAYPQLDVDIVDIRNRSRERDDVFAVPTFVLDDRVLSLGNPQESTLRREIELLLRAREFGTLNS